MRIYVGFRPDQLLYPYALDQLPKFLLGKVLGSGPRLIKCRVPIEWHEACEEAPTWSGSQFRQQPTA